MGVDEESTLERLQALLDLLDPKIGSIAEGL
jgi:hypothetical protein